MRTEGLGAAFKLAAQGVLLVDRLDAGELDAIIGGDNAGELHDTSVIQAQFGPGFDLLGPGRRAAFEHQVGAEEFGGAQQHGAVEARTKVADGGAGSHGHQQGKEQHAQFAGAGIAQ